LDDALDIARHDVLSKRETDRLRRKGRHIACLPELDEHMGVSVLILTTCALRPDHDLRLTECESKVLMIRPRKRDAEMPRETLRGAVHVRVGKCPQDLLLEIITHPSDMTLIRTPLSRGDLERFSETDDPRDEFRTSSLPGFLSSSYECREYSSTTTRKQEGASLRPSDLGTIQDKVVDTESLNMTLK
jgi:hypothetical protein